MIHIISHTGRELHRYEDQIQDNKNSQLNNKNSRKIVYSDLEMILVRIQFWVHPERRMGRESLTILFMKESSCPCNNLEPATKVSPINDALRPKTARFWARILSLQSLEMIQPCMSAAWQIGRSQSSMASSSLIVHKWDLNKTKCQLKNVETRSFYLIKWTQYLLFGQQMWGFHQWLRRPNLMRKELRQA